MNRHAAVVNLLFVACCLGGAFVSPATPGLVRRETGRGPIPAVGREAGELRDDNVLRMEFVWCPPGAVVLNGDFDEASAERNPPGLEFGSGYWMGRYEVSQGEWSQLMETKPWVGYPRSRIGERVAATYVSWNDAVRFCAVLTEREHSAGRLSHGWRYALPTEDQWEYACRAKTTTIFCCGDDARCLRQYAVVNRLDRCCRWRNGKERSLLQEPSPVGLRMPNAWGLCDMHGNVWEWCRDAYVESRSLSRDSDAARDDSYRAIRGGGWCNTEMDCRSSRRDRHPPDHADGSLGFRVALVPAPRAI